MGIVVGICSGGIQFFLLSRMVARVAGGKASPLIMLLGAAQFLLPAAVLLVVALINPAWLVSCGIAIASTLLALSVGLIVIKTVKKRRKAG